MSYNPSRTTAYILERAYQHVLAVPYQVTARWVFYRLLQEGTLATKTDYKRLLSYLSKARKQFYRDWAPDTLGDDSRAPILMQRQGYYTLYFRGHGFESPQEWLSRVVAELNYHSDRWTDQPNYVEVWFEAAAMQSQFLYYLDSNIPVLAFHGDVSIPAKWEAAQRLYRRWRELGVPVKVLYYGDLDPKGEQIPESAEDDIRKFMLYIAARDRGWSRATPLTQAVADEVDERAREFNRAFEFRRVGLNENQIGLYNVPENPERPGTYQWEGLDDVAAQELIAASNGYIDRVAFQRAKETEDSITRRFREHLETLDLEKPEQEEQDDD